MNEVTGPLSVRNWRAFESEAEYLGGYEYPVFSDAEIDGSELQLGPVRIKNFHSRALRHPFHQRLTLRANQYTSFIKLDDSDNDDQKSEDADKTDNRFYHGGTWIDEIVALVSLCLGIRLRAGTERRVFFPEGTSSKITSVRERRDPALSALNGALMVPSAMGAHPLPDASLVNTLPILPDNTAIAIIRAARMYQEAIWLVESAPELSWLLLTSAAETAAVCWRAEQEEPVARMTAAKPELGELLRNSGGDQLVVQVAFIIADYMGATKKFIDFLTDPAHCPPAPSIRPELPEHQVKWTRGRLKDSLSTIYDLRSKALHSGIPFPLTMCSPSPWLGDVLPEKGIYTLQAYGGTWHRRDIPMLLHIYEYIVRFAVINWWKSIVANLDAQS